MTINMHLLQVFISILEIICYAGINLSLLIVVKLVRMKHSLNTINMMFIASFLLNYVLASLRIFYLFNIGTTSFVDNLSNVESYFGDCKMYNLTWAMDSILSVFIHFGMMFCRFIYARYATGLETIGKRLLHGLVYIVTTTFCLQWLLIYPIKNILLEENYPLHVIQGHLCTKTKMVQFGDSEKNKDFSIRPKLLMITFSTLIIVSALFVTSSAHKQTKRYGIPLIRKHLMTMKTQCLYLVLLCSSVISGQILNILIQMFYENLGVETVFLVWWIYQLLSILIFYVVFNIYIWKNAEQNFKEFTGLRAMKFPDQEGPRPAIISPRRDTDGQLTFDFPQGNVKQKKKTQEPGKIIQTFHGRTCSEINSMLSTIP